ncbi:MAG: MFS transporter [Hyphomicrobiales bacterium]|nr:MFS transporter [Hyphomicrobiales bacterium]
MPIIIFSHRIRLSAFYAAFFAVVGVQQPFWPLWLKSNGLSAAEIGVTLAVSIGIKILAAPAAAHIADQTGERRLPMLVCVGFSLLAYGFFVFADSFWPILLVSLVFFAVWPPVMALAESLTVMVAHKEQFDYGRVRLWGSLSFIVTAIVSGRILVSEPADAVLWIVLACILLTVTTCAWLPDVRSEPRVSGLLPIVEILRNRPFGMCLITCGMIQGSHAVYYAFGTLHWQAQGYSEAIIGALWAEGVIAEIILFMFGAQSLKRFGPRGLIILAGLASTVRWLGTGYAESLPAIIALQALHAFSFGAAHLGAMYYIGAYVAPSVSATAQSLYSGIVWGVFLGATLFAAGWLYGAFQGGAFLAMTGLAMLGSLCALLIGTIKLPIPES